MKAASRARLNLDANLQTMLVVPTLITYLLSIVNPSIFYTPLILQGLLMSLQLGGAFIRVFLHGSILRQNYFILMLGYLLSIGCFQVYFNPFSLYLKLFLYIVIPMAFAVYYWVKTMQQALGKFEAHKTF